MAYLRSTHTEYIVQDHPHLAVDTTDTNLLDRFVDRHRLLLKPVFSNAWFDVYKSTFPVTSAQGWRQFEAIAGWPSLLTAALACGLHCPGHEPTIAGLAVPIRPQCLRIGPVSRGEFPQKQRRWPDFRRRAPGAAGAKPTRKATSPSHLDNGATRRRLAGAWQSVAVRLRGRLQNSSNSAGPGQSASAGAAGAASGGANSGNANPEARAWRRRRGVGVGGSGRVVWRHECRERCAARPPGTMRTVAMGRIGDRNRCGRRGGFGPRGRRNRRGSHGSGGHREACGDIPGSHGIAGRCRRDPVAGATAAAAATLDPGSATTPALRDASASGNAPGTAGSTAASATAAATLSAAAGVGATATAGKAAAKAPAAPSPGSAAKASNRDPGTGAANDSVAAGEGASTPGTDPAAGVAAQAASAALAAAADGSAATAAAAVAAQSSGAAGGGDAGDSGSRLRRPATGESRIAAANTAGTAGATGATAAALAASHAAAVEATIQNAVTGLRG